MFRKIALSLIVLTLGLVAFAPTALAKRGGMGGRGDGPVIFVEGQDLYYDSIVTADPLPWKGPFQKLYMGENGLTTQYGPGDPEYRGGRWWVDSPDMGVQGKQDEYDHYFSCPLQGPGRDEP
jgi:hypothetical protein